MFTVAEINFPAQLAELRHVWRSLWERTPQASFLQTREWLESYLFHDAMADDLRVLVVATKGRPVGIVPLMVKRVRSRFGTVRMLTYPLDDWGAGYGPIGANPAAALLGALQHIAHSPRDWDVIDLPAVMSPQGDPNQTEHAMRLSGLTAQAQAGAEAAVIDFDELLTGDQFGLRRQLQTTQRELSQRGPWELIRHRPDGRGSNAEVLRCDLWREAAGLWMGHDDTEREFLRDCYESAAWTGRLDYSALKLHGRTIGSLLAVAGPEQVEPLAAAFAPEHAEAARDVLVGRLLIDGLERGDRRFVFGPRQVELAAEWCPRKVQTTRWTHFAAFGARAQLLRLAQWRGQRVPA
jgi:CelD/BcsL family acetyltransferase involved in cellulose biosynthesis